MKLHMVNAPNVVKCVKDLEIDNIRCFTHTLQLSINSCLVKGDEVSEIIDRYCSK